MTRHVLVALATVALGAVMTGVAPVVAGAQIAGARYCGSEVYDDSPSVEGADLVERMHPLVSRARYADAVRNEQWELALRGLRSDAEQAFVVAGVDSAQQARFVAQLDSVLDVLPRLPNASDRLVRARFIADSVRSVRFRPVMGTDAYRLFRRGDTIGIAGLPPARAKALCWSAMSVDAVLFRLQQPLQLGAIARLARFNSAWANYRTYGYTRQPLELLLFRGSVRDSLPPRRQWLVGHLSLGAEVRGRWRDSLTSNEVMVLELGLLAYRKNYSQYHGASLIAALSGRTSMGYGVMIHAARSMRAGVLLHRTDGRTRYGVVVSTDLYGMLERSKRSVDEGLAVARGIVVLPKPGP